MQKTRVYFSHLTKTTAYINGWDLLALTFVLSIIVLFAMGARQMAIPYQLGEPTLISLDPVFLPHYALRTVIRIVIALFFSLTFTFIFGTWAARSRSAEKILIPLFDILQSIPVLSFLSIFIVSFIALFPNNLLGPECASILAIFTSQAWNITFGFYQSLRAMPSDLQDAADMLHLSRWQRFWHIEVPFSMPSLLWNTMVSLSASWFFVVASEAIAVSNQIILLPGIGSYIAVAIEKANLHAIFYAIACMFVVILIYDQLIFRPLIKWSERFHFHPTSDEKTADSWVLNLLERTKLIRWFSHLLSLLREKMINARFFSTPAVSKEKTFSRQSLAEKMSSFLIIALVLFLTVISFYFILKTVSLSEIGHVFLLGLITAFRIIILIFFASLIWIPIGVWIGMRPQATYIAQPIAQFLAAFPANLVFPVVVILILHFHLNLEIWLSPLMILGSQWYILFNVIAGAASLPKDFLHVSRNLGLTGWLKWKRVLLPAIFPYFVTGAITAAGGAWNASIVAEVVNWGGKTLQATGLGAYIAQHTRLGDFPRIALGTGVMCIFVLIFNRFIWRPLYQLAEERYQIT